MKLNYLHHIILNLNIVWFFKINIYIWCLSTKMPHCYKKEKQERRMSMQYGRTNKAIQWLDDGDIIQHVNNETYFKKEGDTVLSSQDCRKWEEFECPMETFPPFEEFRSITNLHYYNEIKGEKLFLISEDHIIPENHPEADKTKKRWFTKIL